MNEETHQEVQPNVTLQQYRSGAVPLYNLDHETAWETILDVVDYPVGIVNGFWQDEDGEFYDASGMTTNGRDTSYRFIITDPYRVGNFQAIACVTEHYGTMKTKEVYESLRANIEELETDVRPMEIFVTRNGGQQRLMLEVLGLSSWDGPDNLGMQIVLTTSYDGSSKHIIRAIPFNKKTRAPMPIYGHYYNLAAKHTTTIKDRTVDMIPTIMSLVGKWDDEIIPMMSLMCEEEWDRDEALAYAEKLADKMNLAEKHKEKIKTFYASNSMNTNETRHNMYRVVSTISEHLWDVGQDKRLWLNRQIEIMEKTMKGEIARLRKKRA